uniref:Uncharacterized protein n=1 Tax=Romanomermis culicivorax TaxID=13658 RepID=A0A915HPM0_ROMCU
MDDIAQGRAHCPCLLGDFRSKSRDVSTAAVSAANEMYKNYARQYSNVVNSGADSAVPVAHSKCDCGYYASGDVGSTKFTKRRNNSLRSTGLDGQIFSQ